jgi:hypothetical protein
MTETSVPVRVEQLGDGLTRRQSSGAKASRDAARLANPLGVERRNPK